jgi:hypothetical protein
MNKMKEIIIKRMKKMKTKEKKYLIAMIGQLQGKHRKQRATESPLRCVIQDETVCVWMRPYLIRIKIAKIQSGKHPLKMASQPKQRHMKAIKKLGLLLASFVAGLFLAWISKLPCTSPVEGLSTTTVLQLGYCCCICCDSPATDQ